MMKNKIKYYLYTLLTTIAFFINIVITKNGNFQNDAFNFDKNSLISLFAFVCFYIFYKKYSDFSKNFLTKFFALFFSMCMILGESYSIYGNWNLLFGSIPVFLIAIFKIVGYFIFFDRVLDFLYRRIQNTSLIENEKEERKTFWKRFLIILICWLPVVIAFYPAILSPDPSNQIKQFFGIATKYIDSVNLINPDVLITNHHPVLHTILLGGLTKFGSNIGSVNFGLFIYSIIQTFFLAFTLNHVIGFIKGLGVGKKYIVITTIFFSIVPVFPLYAMSPVKDVYFTILLIWYVIFLYKYVKKDVSLNLKYSLYIFLLLLGIMLIRNNGLYVIILSFPFLIFTNKIDWKKIVTIFVFSILIYKSYTNVILPNFGVSPGSVREALSIPFQQTARYVGLHYKDLSSKDKEAIDKILDIDTIATRYKPELADPVKNEFNKDYTKKDLNNYFAAWWSGLLKHPDTYIQATLNNTYGYFYPGKMSWYLYYKYDTRLIDDGINYHYNDLKPIRNFISGYGVLYQHTPVIGLSVNIGFHTFLLIACSLFIIRSKSYKYLIFLSPMLASLLVCIASPANAYFRYAMPYVLSFPLILAITIKVINKNKEKIIK